MDKNITGTVQNTEVSKIQDNILDVIINPVLGFATALCFVLFAYGVFRFLINRTTNPNEVEKGKKHIIYGLIGLFILTSIWSIYIMIGEFFESKAWFIK